MESSPNWPDVSESNPSASAHSPISPLPNSDVEFFHVRALEAALAKLGFTGVTATQLLDAVKEEQRRLFPAPPEPSQSEQGSFPPYKSVCTRRTEPRSEEEKARSRILRDLFKKAFPNGPPVYY